MGRPRSLVERRVQLRRRSKLRTLVPAMGYDCTFHLVDEELSTEELVPALLGHRDPPRAL